MKSKIKYLVFLVLLLFPVSVFAAGGISVSTTSVTMEQGESKNFNIVPNNAAGKVTISSNNTSVATVNKSSEWVESSPLTVTISGKQSGSAVITVNVDAATFDEEVIKKTYSIYVTVKPPKSTNNRLSGLSLSAGTLSPAFNPDTLKYSATIHSSSVSINASKGDPGQTISGTGNKSLKYGVNTFNVVVKSEAGTTRTYTINITRPDNRSTNSFLKSLSVDVGTIKFNKSTTTYSLNVGKDVTSMKISASLEDSKASFVSGFGPRTVNLKYGANSILVKVKAENGSTRTYTIKVEREDVRSTNNNLSSIQVSEGTLNFDKDVTNYQISVPFDVDKIDINALAEDDKSKVEIYNPALVVGDNTIKVTVTSENGVKKVYTINVKRLSEADVLSENNNVSSIDILGHGIEFDPSTKEYDIEIGDEYALVIEVLLEDPTAKYVIEGNEDLKDGSVIKVTSTSESGAINEYKINVNKALKKEGKESSGGIGDGIVGFILGLIVMFFTMVIVNKLKKDKFSFKSSSKVEPKEEVTVSQPVVETTTEESEEDEEDDAGDVDNESEDEEVVESTPVSSATPVQASAPVTSAPVTSAPVTSATSTSVPETSAPSTSAPIQQKPVMQEADLKQPFSQEINQIPENKTE